MYFVFAYRMKVVSFYVVVHVCGYYFKLYYIFTVSMPS